jgi:hypothetical protein
MRCRFKGEFAEGVKERIENAVHRYETVHTSGNTGTGKPKWAFVHFNTPYQGSSYWGVRVENGYMVKAQTPTGLAAAVEAARQERLRRRSQAARQASRSVDRGAREAATARMSSDRASA